MCDDHDGIGIHSTGFTSQAIEEGAIHNIHVKLSENVSTISLVHWTHKHKRLCGVATNTVDLISVCMNMICCIVHNVHAKCTYSQYLHFHLVFRLYGIFLLVFKQPNVVIWNSWLVKHYRKAIGLLKVAPKINPPLENKVSPVKPGHRVLACPLCNNVHDCWTSLII